MKNNSIVMLMLLASISMSKAQKWNYLHIPQNNKILQLQNYDSVIVAITYSGNELHFDLNGNVLNKTTSYQNKSNPQNKIFNDTLFYENDHIKKKVRAPFNNGKIVYDSQNNIYSIHYDTLWKYDGNTWTGTRIQPPISDSSVTYNLPCNYSGAEYEFIIDKSDKLWGTSSCAMGYATTNFWIDLKTMEQRYRPEFGQNLYFIGRTQIPFVDKFNNKLIIPDRDTVYVLDDENLENVKQKIALPNKIGLKYLSGFYKIGGYTSDSILYFYDSFYNNNPFYYNGSDWVFFSKVKSDYLVNDNTRDIKNNVWTTNHEYTIFKNDGEKIDSFTIVNPNDTMNVCYQNVIKNNLSNVRHDLFFYKNYNNEIWIFRLGNQFFIKPETCTNDFSEYYKRNAIKDVNGSLWKIEPPEYYFDSTTIKKYISGQFKTVYANNTLKKPLSKLYFVDNFGNFWATYADKWENINCSKGGCNYRYTQQKLIRFDGTTWTDYGTLDTNIVDGFKGRNNDVWFVTTSKLMKYNGVTWANYDFPVTGTQPYCTIDKKGTIWLGVNSSDLLYEFNGSSWSLHRTNGTHTNFTADMVNGGFWIKTNNGAAHSFNGSDWTVYNSQNGLKDTNFTDILVDAEGDVWFTSETVVSILSHESVVGVDDEISTETPKKVEIYPNPATNYINFKNLDSENTVSIYSLDGTLLQTSMNINMLDLEFLNSGLYTIKIQDKNGVQYAQFVKN